MVELLGVIECVLWLYTRCCVLFFFFKQKTAYEMRISDWSSDVCSSDLRLASLRAEGGPLVPVIITSSSNINLPAPTHLMNLEKFRRSKIGRASCRESVVSVRVDLGGRRIIKKKINNTLHHIIVINEHI